MSVNSGDVVIKTQYFSVEFVGWIAGGVSFYQIQYHSTSYKNGVANAQVPEPEKFLGTWEALFDKCKSIFDEYGWG